MTDDRMNGSFSNEEIMEADARKIQDLEDAAEMKDIDLGSNGEVFPEKHDKVALIDADTIAFAAAVSCEYYEELLPRDMYTDEHWALVITDPGYDEDNHLMYGISINDAVDHCIDKIDTILNRSGCKDFKLHFTVGRESFRYTKVDISYKANRLIDSQGQKTRSPHGLYQIKQALEKKYPLKSKMWIECEADDAVWWLGDKYPEKYVVVAVDKDVLGATKAQAFNYFSRAAYTHPKSGNEIAEIKMKFVIAENPDLFWYTQCMTGDAGDGIIGIKGIGPAKAAKAMKGLKTDTERWEKIVEMYETAGRSMLDALNNMRMVRLDQYNPETNELKLWDPRELT